MEVMDSHVIVPFGFSAIAVWMWGTSLGRAHTTFRPVIMMIHFVQARSWGEHAWIGGILFVLILWSNPFRPSTQRMNAQLEKR
jgi:hypothetical protein